MTKKQPAKIVEGVFNVGQHVVYPAHGVGRVSGVETQAVAGMKLEVYVVAFEQDKLILRVPTAKAASSGMRPLASAKVAAFDPGAAFTMEAWVCLTATTTPYSTWIMGKVTETNVDPWRHFALVVRSDGTNQDKVEFGVSTGAAGSFRSVTAPTALTVGTWTHVAGVFEGKTMRLFLEGKQVAQSTNAQGAPLAVPQIPFAIGNGVRPNGDGGWTNFSGAISQARFWNVARTAEQVAKGMTELQPSDRTGLVAGWSLGEGTGTTAPDYSGNNYALARPANSTAPSWWAATDGRSLDRLKTALHLAAVSPDSALQK